HSSTRSPSTSTNPLCAPIASSCSIRSAKPRSRSRISRASKGERALNHSLPSYDQCRGGTRHWCAVSGGRIPMPLTRVFAAMSAALMPFAGAPVRAEPATDAKRSEFERMLKEYLAAHPEAIQEALDTLAARKAAAKAEQQKAAIKTNDRELFSSPRQVTLGNSSGDVTLVEFFDYNCGYCKRALADLLELM